ncbi:MAG TPA: S8/S53 family peptidase, partial [Longimicrobium sp.]|nr:S8/S53 family peptidase [Longimicrobium sp.]
LRLPVLSGPPRVSDALVFELEDAEAARSAWSDFKIGETPPRGVAAVCRYARVAGDAGARLTALYRERGEVVGQEPFCELVAPGPPPPYAAMNLAGTHHLQLADPGNGPWLSAELTRDRRVRRVYHPAAHYPLDAPGPPPGPGKLARLATLLGEVDVTGMARHILATTGLSQQEREQWGLEECGFRHIWPLLDTGAMRSAIAMIDQGGDTKHRELDGRITVKNAVGGVIKSGSVHASAVAGVLCAHRVPLTGISGCCSAQVDLYNAWNDRKGFDSLAFREALKTIPGTGVRVLNISLGSQVSDPDTEEQIREAVQEKKLIIVAAAGNDDNSEPIYPAAYDGVIAVGATVPGGQRASWSTTGTHVYVSAPGDRVLTVYGKKDLQPWSGTSFAAPMVAAAVWMALGIQPSWERKEILQLLASTAIGPGVQQPGIGFGVLNMRHFARCVVAGKPTCP